MGYSRALRHACAVAAIAGLTFPAGGKDAPTHRYTLVISDRQQMTRMDYPSQKACMAARAAILSQFEDRTPRVSANGSVITMPPLPPTLFCVPR
jgi:hypothetical protein